jgi:hypothetical protein
MKRPLLALTCGDLGTDVVAVESKLKKYMSWGEIWNGVVRSHKAQRICHDLTIVIGAPG